MYKKFSNLNFQPRSKFFSELSAYKDGPENIFLHKSTGQKIWDGPYWTSPTKTKQKDKTATHISGPSLYVPAPV